jgi:TonB-linked SusC/RagA family outer membrane protein
MRKKIRLIGIFVFAFGLCLGENAWAKDNEKTESNSVTQQGNTVTGTVRDVQGPVIGASVTVKGTSIGTVTDVDGKFSLSVGENAVLQVFYLGYITQEIAVGNQTNLNITLIENVQALGEVVVLGYGATARKADLSAAIGVVENMEILKNRPISNAASLLQGQIPGVTVRNNGGSPTDAPFVTIRGQGSRGTESVLWVVDGVPGAPFNFNDIESIVVLKDAASAAIYGSYSGSAGVVMVTTKKAKSGKATVTYEGSYGVSNPVNLPQSLTIEEERQVRQTAYDAAGRTIPIGWDVSKNPWIGETRTDWIDAITRTAPFQRHNLSLSGGNESMTNRLSVQYTDHQGILISTFKKELNMRYDATYKIGKYVRLREDFFWQTYQTRGVNTDDGVGGPFINAIVMPRSSPVYYSDGTYGGTAPKDQAYIDQYGSNFADIHGDAINPVRLLEAQYQFNKPNVTTSSTFFEVLDPIPGLKFTSRFTYRLESALEKYFNYKRLEVGKPNASNSVQYSARRYWKWETENTLNYDKEFGDHRIGALVSTTANKQRGLNFGTGISLLENEDPIYQYLEYGTTGMYQNDQYFEPDNNMSLVGRLSYSWKNRYFATASFRRDYAGRLPKGKKYGDFPGVTASWKLSEEPFMPKSDDFNLLKLRGSWGRIGNLASVPFAYGNPALTLTSTGTSGMVLGSNPTAVNRIAYATAVNPNLTWETSEQIDFGIDAELLNNRLSFSADWFNKRTYNLIRSQDTGWPSYIGVDAKLINEGEIRNTGFEFLVGWNDKVGDFSYFVNATLATLKNKVTDIGPVNPETGEKPVWLEEESFRGFINPYRTIEGGPLYNYWFIKSDGLFQSDTEAAAYVDKDGNRIQPNAKAGDIKFIDQNGDGKINDEDRIYMGAYYPDLTFSLTGGFSYKDFSFSLMLQGVAGSKVVNGWKYTLLQESYGNFNRWNKILDAWPATNEVPRVTVQDDNNNFGTNSDWYLEDASYLRIKNINAAYNLTGLLHKYSPSQLKNSALSVYASIDNLYTFTKYSGMNPEVSEKGLDSGKYPVPQVFSLGIKLTF